MHRMFKYKKTLAILLLLLVGGGFWYWKKQQPVEPATMTVEKGTVTESVSLSGSVEPKEYADLAFTGSGRVSSLQVTEGEEVTKGQLLMTLENPVAQAQYSEAALNAQIVESQERLARRGWDNLKKEQKEVTKLNSELARARTRTVSAQFVSNQVRAPFAGKVTRVNPHLGEVVSPGAVVARVASGNGFVVRASASETEVARLWAGLAATITFEALGGKTFTGTLVSLSESATTNQGVVSYDAVFSFDAGDATIRDGMTADVEVVTAQKEGVTVLPARLLKRVDGKYTVAKYLGGADFAQEEVGVTTGLEGDEGTVEITGGLRPGDKVVTEMPKTSQK